MRIFQTIRENERLKMENQYLKEQITRLQEYKNVMENQWKNWWEFDGTKQQGVENGTD